MNRGARITRCFKLNNMQKFNIHNNAIIRFQFSELISAQPPPNGIIQLNYEDKMIFDFLVELIISASKLGKLRARRH